MVRVSLPCRLVAIVSLTAPGSPALADTAPEQLQIWPRGTRRNDVVLLIGLARMLAFARLDHVYLTAAGRQRSRVFAANAKEDEFGHVAEIEADAAAILPDFMPDDIGFVGELYGSQTRLGVQADSSPTRSTYTVTAGTSPSSRSFTATWFRYLSPHQSYSPAGCCQLFKAATSEESDGASSARSWRKNKSASCNLSAMTKYLSVALGSLGGRCNARNRPTLLNLLMRSQSLKSSELNQKPPS